MSRRTCEQGSIADEFGTTYDLIVCIEVVEHMPAQEAEAAIANFCRHAGDVLFSSSPLDYGETTHVNVRPPEYWAEQFARQGFIRDVDFDASFITPWAVRFRRSAEPIHRIVAGYERQHAPVLRERADLRARLAALRGRAQANAAGAGRGARHDRRTVRHHRPHGAERVLEAAARVRHRAPRCSDSRSGDRR